MAYTTNLHPIFGTSIIKQLEYNFEYLYEFKKTISNSLHEHKNDKTAHKATQISYGDEPISDFVAFLNGRISNLVLGHNGNGINEVKDARTDNIGVGHPTLQDRLRRDYLNYMVDKKAILDKVESTRKELMDIEYRFDPLHQEPQFITDLSPYTNAVMQSFWIDPYTHIIYMTQAYPGDKYYLTRLKTNGQFIDRALVIDGGHGTHNAYRYINGELWIYSSIVDSYKNLKFVRFKYKEGEIKYGRDTLDVLPKATTKKYVTAIYNNKEDLMIFRCNYSDSEVKRKNVLNYIEVRKASDIDNDIDKVLYRFDIPITLTNLTNPMQGMTYDDGNLYWWTGNPKLTDSNLLTCFKVETGEKLWSRKLEIGGVDGKYIGDYAEPEGLSMYYDRETKRKALLFGITVGPSNNRHHKIYSIGQRDVNEILINQNSPVLMSESGGRSKPLPLDGLTKLSNVTEIGYYYIHTVTSKNISDFPLSKNFRDAGWYLEVLPGNHNGAMRQVLTRNSIGRNMIKFERVINALNSDIGPWNFIPSSAGKWERIPTDVNLLRDLKVVGMTFYITTEESKRFKDFPKDYKGVAGWLLEIKGNATGAYTHVLRRNNYDYHHQFLVKNYSSKASSKWSLYEGKEVD